MSRRPVVIDGEMLRAIFTKPRPSDTRPLLTRLLSSIQATLSALRLAMAMACLTAPCSFHSSWAISS